MNDLIALHIVTSSTSEAQSARPGAPVVDDATTRLPRQLGRRALVATLRAVATAGRRWADRLDPACTPAPARS